MAPIPVIVCGTNAEHVVHLADHLAPQFEVLLGCNNTQSVLSEVPTLLKGESVVPSSGVGSNAKGQARTDPALIILGPFPAQELDQIKSAIEAAKPMPLFVADITKRSPGQQGPPSTEMIQQRILESVKAAEQGEGKWAPGVHMF